MKNDEPWPDFFVLPPGVEVKFIASGDEATSEPFHRYFEEVERELIVPTAESLTAAEVATLKQRGWILHDDGWWVLPGPSGGSRYVDGEHPDGLSRLRWQARVYTAPADECAICWAEAE